MQYVPLLLPLAVLAAFGAARPAARVAVVVAVAAVLLEAPAIAMLSEAGGIECPRGCGDGQDLLQGLVFLALPAVVLIGLAWALVAGLRGRHGRSAPRG